MRNKSFVNAVSAFMIGLTFFSVVFLNLLSGIDFFAKDILYDSRRAVNNTIRIITIDEKAIERFGPFGTWDRSVYADLINILNGDPENRPAVIAFDVLFSGQMDNAGDDSLKKAVQENQNIISASHLLISEEASLRDGILSIQETAESLELPYWLSESDDTVGFSNTVLQSNGTVRTAFLCYDYKTKKINSFAYQIYLNYLSSTEQSLPEINTIKDVFLIDYAGSSGDYETVSLVDVLDEKIEHAAFKGCMLLIGAYTTGLQDDFYTSTNRDVKLYGVEIHANILQNLLEGRQLYPVANWLMALICSFTGVTFYYLTQRKKIIFTTMLALGIITIYVICAYLVFRSGLVMPVIYLPLFILLIYAYRYLRIYIEERIHRQKLSNAFKKYVAPQVVDELARHENFEIKLGGELRNVSVLFIDIRGFTPLSEALPPQTVVSILNEYFALVTKAIFENGGTLDKFIGDAAMAVFNAPLDLADYEYRAVCTALDIVAGSEALEQRLFKQYQNHVGFGIGINCGAAVVGNIGCDFRMDYTAIGDTVNTAARLESNAKKGQILISENLYKKVKNRVSAEEIGVISLKGKSEGVFTYNITGRKEGGL